MFIKEIGRGEMIPAWYGVAWTKFTTDSAVCMPIPLNLFFAFIRAVYIFVRAGYKVVPSNSRDAYVQGVSDGIKMASK